MAQPLGGPVLAYPPTAQLRTPAPPTRVVVDALLASHGLRLAPEVRETGATVLTLVDDRTGRPPVQVPDGVVRQLRAWLDTELRSAVA
jgi:hypothetical protein